MTVFFSQFGDNWTWPTTTESGSGHENPQPFSLFANGWNVSALLMILATAFTIFNVKSLPGMWHVINENNRHLKRIRLILILDAYRKRLSLHPANATTTN